MRNWLPYPEWFLNRIIVVAYNVTKASAEVFYGHKDKSLCSRVKLSDKFIMRFAFGFLG
jgi:hypothetical protein